MNSKICMRRRIVDWEQYQSAWHLIVGFLES